MPFTKNRFWQKALKSIVPFSEEKKLNEEFSNLGILSQRIKADRQVFDCICGLLSHIKDISGTFSRLGGDITETELFEVKNYCSFVKAVADELTAKKIVLFGISLRPLDDAYIILNRGESSGFYIADEYSEKLANIRMEKRAFVLSMLNATGEEREQMRQRHLELSAKEEEEEHRIRRKLSEKLLPFKGDMIENSLILARLDILIQKAFLLDNKGGILPTIEANNFVLEDAFNPYIASFLHEEQKHFSPISLSISGVTVITGANMGGKTVALKTVALNAYAAMCGFPVFAKKAVLPFFEFVEILSEDLQSSERGLSSFGGEVVKVNELYRRAKENCGLLLIDEFASGTNFDEGARIFSALLRSLKKTPSMTLLTTHFDGVCKDATARYQIIGLSKQSKEQLRNKKDLKKEDITKYMNYGLVKVGMNDEIPKDALDICTLLGMSDEILSLVEK